MAIILFMGAISGAHLNPAVSLAFALRGDFPWRRVPGYIIVQLVGATLACLFLLAVFGNIQHLGATLPGAGYEDWQALLMEIVLTARPGQRHPRHRLGGPERRRDRGARRRRLHRARRVVVGAGQRHLDEPGALVRTRAGQRRLHQLLGLRRRAARRSRDRRRLRVRPARARRRPDRARRGFGVLTPGSLEEEAATSREIDVAAWRRPASPSASSRRSER